MNNNNFGRGLCDTSANESCNDSNIGTFTLSYKTNVLYALNPQDTLGVYMNKMNQRKSKIAFSEKSLLFKCRFGPIVAKKQSQVFHSKDGLCGTTLSIKTFKSPTVRIVSSALQEMCSKLLNERSIRFNGSWTIQCHDAVLFLYKQSILVF